MDVAVIGGGIGGFSLALQLERAGIDCRVHESGPAYAPLGVGIDLFPGLGSGGWWRALTITAWRPGDRREPDELQVSRRRRRRPAALRRRRALSGSARPSERACARPWSALERPRAARSPVRRVQPVLAVDVDYHGRPGGPLCDAVLRNVAVADELPASHA